MKTEQIMKKREFCPTGALLPITSDKVRHFSGTFFDVQCLLPMAIQVRLDPSPPFPDASSEHQLLVWPRSHWGRCSEHKWSTCSLLELCWLAAAKRICNNKNDPKYQNRPKQMVKIFWASLVSFLPYLFRQDQWNTSKKNKRKMLIL